MRHNSLCNNYEDVIQLNSLPHNNALREKILIYVCMQYSRGIAL